MLAAFLAGQIAEAAPTQGWNYAWVYNDGAPSTDTIYVHDSAVAYGMVGNGDSVRFGACATFTPPGRTTVDDSINPYRNIVIANDGTTFPTAGYAPTVFAVYYSRLMGTATAFQAAGSPIGTPSFVIQSDSLEEAMSASVSGADMAEIADSVDRELTTQHGSGAWTSGSGGTGAFPETVFVYDSAAGALVQGAEIHIKAADTGSYQNSSGPQATNASGYAIFSIDAGTFPVAVSAQTYFQESAYQLVTQASPGGRDTVWLYSVSLSPPAGGDSCNVAAFTDKAGSWAEFDPKTKTQDTTDVFLNVYPMVAYSDANGTIQKTLPRTAATGKSLKWKITIKGPKGNVIGQINEYTVPDQAVDTLLLP